MTEPTAEEVLDIALINRARLDPAAEAARFGIDLNEGLAAGTISAVSKQPLAWSDALNTSARAHSQSMINNDFFAHNDPTTGSNPQSRAVAAGYAGGVGENIAAQGSSAPLAPAVAVPLEHQDLFVDSGVAGRGHRTNMLDGNYQQIGTGVASGVTHNVFGGTFNTVMLTEDYGDPASSGQFLTGIAYNDADANAFYSVGEGRSGISVTTPGGNLATGTAGAYSGVIGTGSQSLTFSGGDLAAAVSLVASVVGGRNALIDLVGQSTIETSTSITETSGITKIIGLGTIGLTLTAASGDDTIIGTKGDDVLNGGVGGDHMTGGIGNDTYIVDNVNDLTTENTGEGTDTVQTTLSSYTLDPSVENLIFTDGATHTGFGNALANVMTGGTGSDTLVAHTVAGLFAQEHDTLSGGDGNDTLYGEAADTLNGGAGFDVLQLINDFAMNLDLVAAGIEYVVSGFGNDTYTATTATTTIEVYGGGGNDQITSGSGNDNLWAGVGNDTLVANDGNDLLVGDLGADSLSGGPGSDRLYVDSSDTFIDGGTGFDAAYIATGAGTSLNLAVSSLEWVADFSGGNDTIDGSGSSANLEIYAAGGTDSVTGGSGADFVWGEAGNDTLTGNGGNDTLVGGSGSDRITGGTGTDALYGNSGGGGDTVLDTFVFTDNWGTDFVFDFEHGIDKLDLSAVTGVNSFADLTLTNTPDGHCYVSFGGNLIALAGMAGQIAQGDFIL